jgi:hypothetical protein
MLSNYPAESPSQSQPLVILKLLWKKFLKQTPWQRVITLGVILLTIFWMLVFYSSFVIWQVFSFVMTKIVLHGIQWYLQREET